MPEGPSIVILKEEVAAFAKKKVTGVSGNTKVEKERLLNKKLTDFKSWGKHFLICFPKFYLRIHLGSPLAHDRSSGWNMYWGRFCCQFACCCVASII